MRKLTLATGIVVMAMTLGAPFALAQTNSGSAPNAPGTGMMYDQAQGQPQGQPETPRQTQTQTQAQRQPASYGPGMMSGTAHGQGGYGGMMGGYGMGWMGGYGGIWLAILLVLLVAGFVVWAIKQKAK